MELVELIGLALWSECEVLTYLWQYVLSFNLYLTHLPKVINGVKAPAKCKDRAAKTLDLVTASSSFLQHNTDYESKNIGHLQLNKSSMFLLNCEELLWTTVVDMIRQAHGPACILPTPHWDQYQSDLTHWQEVGICKWTWPQRDRRSLIKMRMVADGESYWQ
jgi:hypothetical protein